MSTNPGTTSGSIGKSVDFISLAKSLLRRVGKYKWLFPAIGVISMVVHFWRIGYLPQITIADVGLVAAATTAFGFVALTLFLFVIMGPALCFEAWSIAEFIPRAPSARLRARRTPQKRCSTCHQQLPRSAALNMVRKTMLPILWIAYAGFSVAAAFWAVVLFVAMPDDTRTALVAVGLVLSIIGFCIGVWKGTPASFRARKVRRRNRWTKYFWLCTSLYGFVIPTILLVGWVILRGVDSSQSVWNLLLLIVLPGLHVATYALQRSGLMVRTVALAVMGLYIIFFTGAIYTISDLAAAKFRLGMLKRQDILVTPLGCDLARLSGVTQQCGTATGATGDLLCIKNVQILTRLGSHVVVADPEWSPRAPSKHASVAIPAAEVRGWFGTPRDDKDVADSDRVLPTLRCKLPDGAAQPEATKPE